MINYEPNDLVGIASIGVYMGAGCFDDISPDDLHAVIEDSGYIGLTVDMCTYAEYIYQLSLAGSIIAGYPGVFEYEVAEPFGLWFRTTVLQRGERPTPDMVRTYLLADVYAFFAGGVDIPSDEPNSAELYTALLEVPFPFGEPE